MRKLTISLIFQSLVFLIPISYFTNSTGTANGVQWVLFRYQQDIFGNYLSSIFYTSLQMMDGGFLGQRAVATLLWDIGAGLLIVCFVLQIFSILKKNPDYRKYAGIITIISGLLILVSSMVQYGVLLSGPYGFCIPFGTPVLIGIGWITLWNEKTGLLAKREERENKRSKISDDLILIFFVAIFVKIIVFSVSMFATIVWVNQDISLYQNYLNSALSGEVPYVDYIVEYPQLFFIPVFLAAIPSLILNAPSLYQPSFNGLMFLLDMGILAAVYFIGLRLFGQEKALVCGMLYATAFSSAFLVLITYDSFPTFLLLLGVLLFIYGKEIPSYISATVGGLSKWFPAFSIPFFILYTIKNKRPSEQLKNGLLLSGLILIISIIPFLVVNYQAFFRTYLFHVNREAYYRSLIYYLDNIARYYFHSEPFVGFSLIFLTMAEVALLYWYFRYLDGDESTLCYAIFLSVFCFIVLNKVFAPYYTVWIVPFLALFLVKSVRHMMLFYILQAIMYFECPILLQLCVREYVFAGSPFLTLPNLFQPFIFYSVKFLVLFLILWVIIWDLSHDHLLKKCDT